METKAKYLDFTDKVIRDDETKELLQGDVYIEGAILRFRNGMLHSDGEPAVETDEGHIEYWKNGKLHRDGGPAVCTPDISGKIDLCEEYWIKGTKI